MQLGIGNQVAQRRFERRAGLPQDGSGDLPHGPLGQRHGRRMVSGHQLLHTGVDGKHGHNGACVHTALRAREPFALHDDLARRLAHHAACAGVHAQGNVGHQRAIQARAGQQKWALRVHAGVVAHIGPMGVARHHYVDRRVQPLKDGHDVAAEPRATGLGDAGRGASALVDHHHDDIGALGAQLRHQRVGSGGLVLEPQPDYAGGRHHGGGGLKRETDEPQGNRGAPIVKPLEPRGRQQRLTILAHGVGGQKTEAGALKRTGYLAGRAHSELLATAMLQP